MHAVIAHDLTEKPRTKDVILEENVSFTSLLLPTNILKGLTECGFRKPSPIQFKAIPLGRCGFDLIVKSKSGTGKTLVFSTIALETVNPTRNQVQVLILVPTREIAVQIQQVLKNIGHFIDGLKVESFIGGLPLEDDIKKAKQCHIAVGAPGRVKHLITIGALSTEFVRLFVLDEADKLMETTFQNDINEIYNTLSQRKQLVASSATYPQELDTFLSNYMLSPTHVSSENETPILLGLKQFVSILKTSTPNVAQMMKLKNETLLDIFSKVSFTQCLVFSNYQTRAESISNYLNHKGWSSSFISAAQSQIKRLEAVNNLKDFKSRILLSTDLTSRGIDAPNVDLVINYDIPLDAVTYLHRMGRAGRYGSSGICINLALEGDELRQLQNVLGTIGASNISISVLPPLEDKSYDLWHLDGGSFEQIHGLVSSDGSVKVNQDIKNQVMALKQVGSGKKHNKKKGDKKKENVNGVVEVLKSKEKEVEELYQQLSQVDTDSLLDSLSSGHVQIQDSKNTHGCEVDALLNLVSEATDMNEEDAKKRKRVCLNESNKGLHQEKRTNSTTQAIFHKNKALLGITKLLFDQRSTVDEALVDSLGDYLTISRKEELGDHGTDSVEEILGSNLEQMGERIEEAVECGEVLTPKTDQNVVVKEENNLIQDIFKIGYNCAVGKDKKKWEDYVPTEELEAYQEFLKQEVAISSGSEDDYEDEEEDYEMQESDDDVAEGATAVLEDGTNQNRDISLQWVPVVPTEDSNEARAEYYSKCYEDCSTTLWQNGLTFETVEDFDNWYYHWQEQLSAVRTYVQQNIYVEEMSKYQRSRFTNS